MNLKYSNSSKYYLCYNFIYQIFRLPSFSMFFAFDTIIVQNILLVSLKETYYRNHNYYILNTSKRSKRIHAKLYCFASDKGHKIYNDICLLLYNFRYNSGALCSSKMLLGRNCRNRRTMVLSGNAFTKNASSVFHMRTDKVTVPCQITYNHTF